jgi:hypothetical protein
VLRRWLGDCDAKAGAHRVAHRANDQPKVEHAETKEYEVDAATAAAARILIVEGENHRELAITGDPDRLWHLLIAAFKPLVQSRQDALRASWRDTLRLLTDQHAILNHSLWNKAPHLKVLPALCVADHWANRKLLQAMLAHRGFSAACAENGQEAVQVRIIGQPLSLVCTPLPRLQPAGPGSVLASRPSHPLLCHIFQPSRP